MKKLMFAFAAALALPLQSPALSQTPAHFDVDQVHPTFGSWSYRPIAGGSESAFTDLTGSRRLIVRCIRANRSVAFVRTGVPAAAPTLSVWTSTLARSVPATFQATNELTAMVAATDPLLDAIAFSRGRFATAAAGTPLLTVPAWPETARVIEDCRS